MSESRLENFDRFVASAETHFAAQRYREMHQACMEAVKLNARHPRPYFLLGLVASEHGRFDKALELFDRSLAYGVSAEAHAMRARCLIAFSRPVDARKALEAAAALDPQAAHTLDTIGVGFARIGDHERAGGFFERAVALSPSNTSYLYNLGTSQQFSGDLDGAEATFRRLLEIEPAHARALSALVQMRKQKPDDHHLPELERAFAALNAEAEPETALQIGHAIAKTFEDFGEHEASFDWLQKAKAAKRRAVGYRYSKDEPVFAAARHSVPEKAHEIEKGGFETDEPIFIVGMPRTGTTLVDRILSSHPDVTSAGELSHFAVAAKRQAATPSPFVLDEETLLKGPDLDFVRLGKEYLDSTRPLTGRTRHFTDKMPLNFFYAGLIHAALPNARIVCVMRDPLDTCFSNFRQLFATTFTYYVYNLDLDETAHYVSAYGKLMDHWRQTLPPDRFLMVHYENIIKEQEAETRRLLAFCGLDWHEACLDFHLNKAPVATASAAQVRKPLYSTSIGQWKRYGAAAERLKKFF